MARMGVEEEARRIQELFLQGRKEAAVRAVPDAFADEISLIGPRARIAERLELWRTGPVTDPLATAPDPHTLRVLAELGSWGRLSRTRTGPARSPAAPRHRAPRPVNRSASDAG